MRSFLKWIQTPIHFAFVALGAAVFIIFLAVIVRYREPYPYIDTVVLNSAVALDIREGRFEASDMFALFNGHRVLGTLAPTVFFAQFTSWNLLAESNWVLFVGTLNAVLLLVLFHAENRTLTHFALVPVLLLMLSLHSAEMWVMLTSSVWQHGLLFVFLALCAVMFLPRGWSTLGVVSALSIVAMFTSTIALGVWVSGFLLMAMRGYRRELIIYFVVGVLAVGLSSSSLISGDTSSEFPQWQFNAPDIGYFLSFVMLYLGSTVSGFQIPLAWAGAIGVIAVLLASVGYLWHYNELHKAHVWLALAAFALVNGALIALGRTQLGIENAMRARYTYTAHLFWIAALLLLIIVMHSAYQRRQFWWVNGGIALLILAGVGHGYTLTRSAGYIYEDLQGGDMGAALVNLPDLYECLAEYPLSREGRCIHNALPNFPYEATLQTLDRLAAYRMTGYAQRPVTPIFTSQSANDWVVIQSQSAFRALHIQNFLVEQGLSVVLLVPPSQQPIVDSLALEAPFVYSREQLPAELSAAQTIWWINERNITGLGGYSIASHDLVPYNLIVTQYRQALPAAQTPLVYGDTLAAQAWDFPQGLSVPPCGTVTLRSDWQLLQPTDAVYKMTFVLTGADGVGISRDDRPPHHFTNSWRLEQTYHLAQTLTVPCDLPAGDYSLLLGVYEETPTGIESLGEIQYLTTLNVP